MARMTPFFEVKGKKYEIKRTRYLVAEFDRLREQTELSEEDNINVVKAQSLIADVQKYSVKMKELEDKFFETLDDEDERKYLKVKALYEKALDELARLEAESGSITKARKQGTNVLEKVAIIGLTEQYDMSYDVAKKTWESFVDEKGNDYAVDWLSEMSNSLFGSDEDEDENSFLSQMRKRRENKANIRKKK